MTSKTVSGKNIHLEMLSAAERTTLTVHTFCSPLWNVKTSQTSCKGALDSFTLYQKQSLGTRHSQQEMRGALFHHNPRASMSKIHRSSAENTFTKISVIMQTLQVVLSFLEGILLFQMWPPMPPALSVV